MFFFHLKPSVDYTLHVIYCPISLLPFAAKHLQENGLYLLSPIPFSHSFLNPISLWLSLSTKPFPIKVIRVVHMAKKDESIPSPPLSWSISSICYNWPPPFPWQTLSTWPLGHYIPLGSSPWLAFLTRDVSQSLWMIPSLLPSLWMLESPGSFLIFSLPTLSPLLISFTAMALKPPSCWWSSDVCLQSRSHSWIPDLHSQWSTQHLHLDI